MMKQLDLFPEIPAAPPPIDIDQLKWLVGEAVEQSPGITTAELCQKFKSVTRRDIDEALKLLATEGKILDHGWSFVQHEFSEGSSFVQHELRVCWVKAAGSATTPYKYPWLYQGNKAIIYIGGGNHFNPKALARSAQVQKWIDLKIPPVEICDRIKLLKSGNWKV